MLKIKKGKNQAVKSYLLIIPTIILFQNCVSQNIQETEPKLYSIQRYSSANKTSYLELQSYDYKDSTKLPAGFRINGVVLVTKIKRNDNIISVLPGNYVIEAVFVGKEMRMQM